MIKKALLDFKASVRFISGFELTLGRLEKDSFQSEGSKKQELQKSTLNAFSWNYDVWKQVKQHGINNPLPQQKFLSVEEERLEREYNFGGVEYRERAFKKAYTPFDDFDLEKKRDHS